jgi:type VI protein secretion system component Hcp
MPEVSAMHQHFAKVVVSAAALLAVMVSARTASAAIDYYLTFSDANGAPVCRTASQSSLHPGSLQLFDLSFGIASSATPSAAGKLSFKAFTFAKKVDEITTCIANLLSQSKSVAATLYVVKSTSGTSLKDYIVIQFKGLVFTAQDFVYGDDYPKEAVSAAYTTQVFSYYAQKADGSYLPPTTFTGTAQQAWTPVLPTTR